MALALPAREFTYTARDCMLYALGIGMGADPLDESELRFVVEKNLLALPSMAAVIAWDRATLPATGINMVMLVHGEQRIILHRPLPVAGTIVGQPRIVDIFDKGAGRGAVLLLEMRITEKASGALLATNLSTIFARGDGGFGGKAGSGPEPHRLPDRPPDAVLAAPTLPQQALLYRLSGDRNPLHADPAFARAAGFPRPILHGLCTYGFACRAIVKTWCPDDPGRMASLDARFSAPVFPGETISTEMWRDGNVISFRASVTERNSVVLSHGRAELRDQGAPPT